MNKFSKNRVVKTINSIILSIIVFSSVSCSKENTFVILSTNDMHAQIDKFPALASAIEQCRDTVDVILVDAGDRWTGNAFVDLVEHYSPIYELMNHLKYDVVTFGNHEFDKGQAYLAVANRQAEFPIVGANITSHTETFPQPAPYHIVEIQGKKIAFVGVTGNYDSNNHPAGKDESYEGIVFSDPQQTAGEYGYLAQECDMLIYLSHSGLDRDREFALSSHSEGFDQIISAHSHDQVVETVGGKLLSQTGSRLKNIGATTVKISKSGEVTLSHRNIPLSAYTPNEVVAHMVKEYYNNPELNAAIGNTAAPFNSVALRNLFAESIRSRTNSSIGLYHAGGVRIDTLMQGEVSLAHVLNAEPFGSTIATCTMTPEQLRGMIMAKFNDKINIGEAHYLDITTTVPYTIITDPQSGDAVDVEFPTLDVKRSYKVAMGDYIYKTYRGLEYTNGVITEIPITETLQNSIAKTKAISPDYTQRQLIVKQEAEAQE